MWDNFRRPLTTALSVYEGRRGTSASVGPLTESEEDLRAEVETDEEMEMKKKVHLFEPSSFGTAVADH